MKRIVAIFLSLLLLVSSSGIAYSQHFCGDYEMISQITLGEKPLSCGMTMDAPECEGAVQDRDCCDNHYTQITTDDTFVKATFDLDLNHVEIALFVSIYSVYETENYPINTNTIFFAEFHPPPLEYDFQVLYETFLI